MIKNSKSRSASKISSLIIGILLFTSCAVFPQRVHAQFVVHDPLNYIENTLSAIGVGSTAISTNLSQVQMSLLNPIAWMLAKETLQSVVMSTINSVNRGPNGAPGFVTNLSMLLQQVGDTAANNFFAQLSTNSAISSPFQTAIASAIENNYLRSTGNNGFFNSNPYTLNQVTSNDAAFLGGNFSQGGLMAFMSAWKNPANNPFGAADLAAEEVNSQVSNAQGVQGQELTYGQGFLSSRGNCNTTTTGGTTQKTASSNSTASTNSTTGTTLTSLSANSTCQSKPITSPGSTIKASLDKAFGSGIDTLVNARSLDEITSALLSQLMNQIFTSGGVAGISEPTTNSLTSNGSAATAPTYFDQTDPNINTVNTQLSTTFISTISQQITQVQQFQANWKTINNAALAANAALSKSTCYPNAETIITSSVQPVLQQAATELQNASSDITALQSIQSQASSANTTADPTTSLSNVSTAYSSELATLPSAADISYAQAQSIDTGTTSPSSLYTQMNQLAAAANTCSTPLIVGN